MTLEEKRSEARLIIKRNKAAEILASRKKPVEVEEPVEAEEPEYTATPLEQTINAIKGFPAGVIETAIDTPTTAQDLIPKALNWVAGKGVNVLGQNNLTAQALMSLAATTAQPTLIPKERPSVTLANDPLVGDYYNALAGKDPNVDPLSLGGSLRTGAEFASFGPINALRNSVTSLPDWAAGVGGAVGQYVADNEMGSLAGIPAAVVAAIMRKDPNMAVNQAIKVVDNASPSPDTSRYEQVRSAVDDAGEEGTLADVVGDSQELYDLEAGSRSNLSINRNYENGPDTARQNQLASRLLEPFGSDLSTNADSATALNLTEQARQNIVDRGTAQQLAIDNAAIPQREAIVLAEREAREAGKAADELVVAATAATSAAKESALPLSTRSVAKESGDFMETVNTAAKKNWDETVQPLWDEFDKLPEVPLRPIQEAMLEYQQSLTPTQWADFSEKYLKFFKRFTGEEGKTMLPLDIQSQLARMKSEITNLVKKGESTPESRQLGDFVKLIEKKLSQSPDLGATPLRLGANSLRIGGYADNSVYGRAKEASTTFYKRFNPRRLGETRQNSYPEEFSKNLNLSDESGAVLAADLAKADIPGAPQALAKTLQALARRGGKVDDVFMRRYEDIMEAAPSEISQNFSNFVMTQKAQKAAEKAATVAARTEKRSLGEAAAELKQVDKRVASEGKVVVEDVNKATSALNKTVLAEFAKDPSIDTLLSNNDTAGLKRLGKLLNEGGVGSQFKSRIRDSLKNKKWGTDIDETHRLQQKLVDAGIISQDDVVKMNDRIYSGTKRDSLRRKAIASFLSFSGKESRSLEASLGAAALMRFFPGGSSLILAGAVRRAIKNQLEKGDKGKSETTKILEDFLINPKKYLAAVENRKEPQVMSVLTMLVGADAAAKAINDKEQE